MLWELWGSEGKGEIEGIISLRSSPSLRENLCGIGEQVLGDLSLTLLLFAGPWFPGGEALRSHPPANFCGSEIMGLKECMSLTASPGQHVRRADREN